MHECHACVQVGGSDQWGNITAGTDLVRKLLGEDTPQCYGLTFPLLVRPHLLRALPSSLPKHCSPTISRSPGGELSFAEKRQSQSPAAPRECLAHTMCMRPS